MVERDKLVLRLHINCFDRIEVKSEKVTMLQILFDGSAEGKYFNGNVMPGGVDTQTIFTDGSGSLSARYCLEGIDDQGAKCRMYIANDGVFGQDYTTPKITTDSDSLRWMNDCDFTGRVIVENEEVTIEIFMK